MCGRYTLRVSPSEIEAVFGRGFPKSESGVGSWLPRFNIAPTQKLLIARRADPGDIGLAWARWGLYSDFAKSGAGAAGFINARSETVFDKPSFRRGARFQRCLVPADGYYEWRREGSKKTPFFFQMRDEGVFALAGIFGRGLNAEGRHVEACAILTTGPNDLSRPIHDRMPVILSKASHSLWLDPSVTGPSRLRPLFEPYPASAMKVYSVSSFVNSAGNDERQCVEPYADDNVDGPSRPASDQLDFEW